MLVEQVVEIERGEKEGRGGEREAKIRREREREGMRNRVSQTMKREEDREARNVFHGRLMDGCSQKRRAPLFSLLDFLAGGTAKLSPF